MKDHRTREYRCLACGKRLDAAMNVQPGVDSAPSPGDVTICLGCHHIMAFADDLTVRELTGDEIHEIAGDPTVLNAMRALGAMKQAYKKHFGEER